MCSGALPFTGGDGEGFSAFTLYAFDLLLVVIVVVTVVVIRAGIKVILSLDVTSNGRLDPTNPTLRWRMNPRGWSCRLHEALV